MILKRAASRLIVFDGGRVTVFEGSYGEFLEKGGWSEEREDGVDEKIRGVKALSEGTPPTGPGKASLNRKDMRRARAELVSERSRVLGPIKDRISRVEEEIMRLESLMAELNERLALASHAGAVVEISELSKSHRESERRIEALFSELESFTREYDSLAKEFDLRLTDL